MLNTKTAFGVALLVPLLGVAMPAEAAQKRDVNAIRADCFRQANEGPLIRLLHDFDTVDFQQVTKLDSGKRFDVAGVIVARNAQHGDTQILRVDILCFLL